MAMDDQTLDELDPPVWPNASEDDTYLVRRCHELRRKPMGEYTAEDLRIMIGQQIALPHLVPRALNVLAADPLVSGDYFPGDLFEAVLRVDRSYWADQPEQLQRLRTIVETLAPMDPNVRAAVEAFRAEHA
jgi:CDI immunity proteins